MKVTITRSGGFAGITELIGVVDTSALDAAHAQEVEQRVIELGFFSLPENIPATEVGADLFRYEVTVSKQGRQHTVRFMDHDGDMLSPLRKLVDTVIKLR